MEYSFDVDLATKYGVDEAIMIKSFQYWIRLNKANKSNFYDGHYWTYNTIKSLSLLFPFWSEKQVRTVLQNLLNRKVLIKGNYNKMGFDRTIWYAFMNENDFLPILKKENPSNKMGKSILPNGQMQVTEVENQSSQTVNTIPITNTITNTITNSDIEEKKEKKPSPSPKKIIENLEYYQEFCQVLNYLSEKTDVKYSIPKDAEILKKYKNYILIKEILKDGNTPDSLISVINSKYNEWISDEKMFRYLVPSTLFRKSNFEKYIIQAQIKQKTNGSTKPETGYTPQPLTYKIF